MSFQQSAAGYQKEESIERDLQLNCHSSYSLVVAQSQNEMLKAD